MDRASLPPPPIAGTTPEDVGSLLDAARAALEYLDDLDKHAPEGFCMGGEQKLRRQLREAVRRCSFEMRPCRACDDGTTHAPTRHPMERPRTISCPECGGTGEARVYSYGPPKARRG